MFRLPFLASCCPLIISHLSAFKAATYYSFLSRSPRFYSYFELFVRFLMTRVALSSACSLYSSAFTIALTISSSFSNMFLSVFFNPPPFPSLQSISFFRNQWQVRQYRQACLTFLRPYYFSTRITTTNKRENTAIATPMWKCHASTSILRSYALL